MFAPIRAMQDFAVTDQEEISFVDGEYKRWVEVAWRRFRPQARAGLDEAVAHQAVFHAAAATHRRLTALRRSRSAAAGRHIS